MKWKSFSITAGMQISCSVCGKVQDNLIFTLCGMNEEQANWIEKIWDVDPYADFLVCKNCIQGYCGDVPGVADKWLKDRVGEFKQSNN